MRAKKERKPVRVICIDCGCGFTAFSSKALRCEECRKEERKNAQREAMSKLRKSTKKTRPILPKTSIGEVLRKMESYNKENGTHLSYGQFVAILEKGAR